MSLVQIVKYTRRDSFDSETRTGGVDVLRIPEILLSHYKDPMGLMEKVNREIIPFMERMGNHRNIQKLLLLFPRIMLHRADGRKFPFRVRTANEKQLECKLLGPKGLSVP